MLLSLGFVVMLGADWNSVNGLMPGQRVVVQHQGKLEAGLFAYARLDELVLTTKSVSQLHIPKDEVEIVAAQGTESPELKYWANVRDQLRPTSVVVYQRDGARLLVPPRKKKFKL